MAVKAVLSIVFFLFTYLLLIALAIGLTIALGYAGMMIIAVRPMFLTIMLGLGLMSVGVFVLIFLFKFITKKYKVDRSHLVQITEEEEPKLFQLIRELVDEVHTSFPKKVYLSHDVNAAVFYNSSFWSMFFPVRKNLLIGVGLINTVSTTELKAILAHEFGHFSQRSMKIGSYVYNVNQVIYNQLNNDEGFNSMLSGWANSSSYFRLFVPIAIEIVKVIQSILKQVYKVVNLSYMALSREMEFHADAVAAHVTGAEPLVSSLLRTDLADQSFNIVANFYNQRIQKGIKTDNLYSQQFWTMNFLAQENNIAISNGLPQLMQEDFSRFNKSKLVIKNQWASHPTTAERIERLRALGLPEREADNSIASSLLSDEKKTEELFTRNLFNNITYAGETNTATLDQFTTDYLQEIKEGSFPKMYNGYYDNKNVGVPKELVAADDTTSFAMLFSDEAVDMIYTANALENDIATIEQIGQPDSVIKTFDYDGKRYKKSKTEELLAQLRLELEGMKEDIARHDARIHQYFLSVADETGHKDELEKMYKAVADVLEAYPHHAELYNKMIDQTAFIQHKTAYDLIEENFGTLRDTEKELKQAIRGLINDVNYSRHISTEIMDSFRRYLGNIRPYFNRPAYDNDTLDIMYSAMRNYLAVVVDTIFKCKKDILDLQAYLVAQHQGIEAATV